MKAYTNFIKKCIKYLTNFKEFLKKAPLFNQRPNFKVFKDKNLKELSKFK
jgi:hypothetical protein